MVAAFATLGVPAAQAAGGNNDPSCRPTSAHPYPVVLLHGLGATYYEDINVLQSEIASRGYCTFSSTRSTLRTPGRSPARPGHRSERALERLRFESFDPPKSLLARVVADARQREAN